MKKIIVDTNIIFSCLLNAQGTIGDLIFEPEGVFEFYSCQYMRLEIRNHWTKLKKISRLSEGQLETAYNLLLSRLNFIHEELIPEKIWQAAEMLVKDIDEDDVAFLALTRYLKGGLWTGDKRLYEGLRQKGFRSVYNTQDCKKLHNRLTRF